MQDKTKKRQVNEFLELEIDVEKRKEYKIEEFKNSAVYNEAAKG